MAKIRIIDDDVEQMNNLAAGLKKLGHVVSTMDRTEGAAKSLIQDKPDVLILDVMFPGDPSAGFNLAREIRKTPQLAKLPVIMLTDVNQQFPMDFSMNDADKDWMPVQDFVEKPADPKKLSDKIAKLLAPPKKK
jgi:CheY-like chemotaxis protein